MSEEASGGGVPTLLVVDDERNIRRTLDMVLRGDGYDVVEAADAERALEILESGERHVDLAILDINLPGMSGVDLLALLRRDESLSDLPVIVISGHAAREDVAQAIKLGAADFFEKPLSRERVLVSVKNALRTSHLSREMASLLAEVEPRYRMIGESPAMKRLLVEIERVAPMRTSVLVTGETGTGKELVSRALHRLSRRPGPFVRINCGSIPRDLVESELFGHERGAFTGAQTKKRGLFEAAHGGTLFLDEIGDMELAAQVKLLRALESGEIVRIGGTRPIPVDVRLVAATHRDLQKAVADHRFREDLYFRLAVFPIHCPPLADRPDDIPALAEAFLSAFCKDNGLPPKTFSPEALAELRRRRFPGNIRELRNTVEHGAILADRILTIADLPEDPHASPFDEDRASTPADAEDNDDGDAPPTPRQTPLPEGTPILPAVTVPTVEGGTRPPTLREVREHAERVYMIEVLAGAGWNVSKSARVLGMERTNLQKRIRQYGIKRGEAPAPKA